MGENARRLIHLKNKPRYYCSVLNAYSSNVLFEKNTISIGSNPTKMVRARRHKMVGIKK